MNIHSMNSYIHIFVYHQWFFWTGCHLYDQTCVGGAKYEFMIAGRGENCSLKIACLHQCIYLFHVSVVHLYLYIYIV